MWAIEMVKDANGVYHDIRSHEGARVVRFGNGSRTFSVTYRTDGDWVNRYILTGTDGQEVWVPRKAVERELAVRIGQREGIGILRRLEQ